MVLVLNLVILGFWELVKKLAKDFSHSKKTLYRISQMFTSWNFMRRSEASTSFTAFSYYKASQEILGSG